MRNYTERYVYDAVGNFEQLIHQAANGDWTRTYSYQETSPVEPGKVSNRLSSTSMGASTEPYAYDAHGNTTSMPHLTRMDWDFKDMLSATSRQAVNDNPPPGLVPETTYYVYDAGGQRVRKVTERQNGSRKDERIYLGGFEIYREFKADGTSINLGRETLHVMDDKQRIALVETRSEGNDGSPAQLVRYQVSNHLGSASVEIDDKGGVISYEEYFPYGASSYQAVDASLKAAAKRYRYTGKERDEETGFSYHRARYYAAWLCRWSSSDRTSINGGLNTFQFVSGNPIRLVDPNGAEGEEPSFWQRHGTRIVGAIQVIGGALEIAAGAAGLAAPTGVTQVLGTVALAHGADTVATGLHTLLSGNVQETLTQQAVSGTARFAGASPETAHSIGAGADFVAGVVPSVGLGLAKAAAARGLAEAGTQAASHAAPEVAAHAAPEAAAHAAPEAAAHAAPEAAAHATPEAAAHAAPEAAAHAAPEAAARAAPEIAARAAGQGAESVLRVRIVDALERAVQRQGQRLAAAIAGKDAAFLQRLGLSPRQINILLNRQTSRPFAAIYGQAMERLVDRAVRSSSLLSRYLRHVGNKVGAAVAGSGRPDWVGRGIVQGLLVDLTTLAGKAAHHARYYGEKMLVLTYVRP
jgi:RHS repeat-associated protein